MLAWVWVVTERKEAKTFAFANTLQSLQFSPYLTVISLNCSVNTPENMKMCTNNAMNVPESVWMEMKNKPEQGKNHDSCYDDGYISHCNHSE